MIHDDSCIKFTLTSLITTGLHVVVGDGSGHFLVHGFMHCS